MKKPIIDFPCQFTIKIMGPNTPVFTQAVDECITSVYGALDHSHKRQSESKNKKYQSISMDLFVESQDQLDTIYRALNQVEGTLMLL